jgi:hypothetical protein
MLSAYPQKTGEPQATAADPPVMEGGAMIFPRTPFGFGFYLFPRLIFRNSFVVCQFILNLQTCRNPTRKKPRNADWKKEPLSGSCNIR